VFVAERVLRDAGDERGDGGEVVEHVQRHARERELDAAGALEEPVKPAVERQEAKR